ncbi:MAG: histidinol-phosphate transaminase, partial [Deltaproteobacteria bacterium]|nr:histidinol-phosphate transaminase [Deltaproteobacteria bacterium]
AAPAQRPLVTVKEMFREAIEQMAPYTPGEQPRPGQRLIKLNTNENPYPPSPRVKAAIVKAAGSSLRLYPPPRADDLVNAAARLYGISREMILAGNGSDELLAMLFRAVLARGDKVAYAMPTYSLYDTLAAIQESQVAAVPLGPGFTQPLVALAAERAALTIVCNPNSPCGSLASPAELDDLARRLDRRLLAIDEAYVDFAACHALPLVKRHPNVIVLRSFSKSFSLAGMRVGLCFAQPPVIEQLLKVKDSYNLSRLAVSAGAAALADIGWMRRNIERIKRVRAVSEKRLRQIGFEVPPSQANFVLARIPGHDMAAVAAGLRRRGILVRHFPQSVFHDSLRISIGTPAQMDGLFKALEPLIRPVLAANGAPGRGRRPLNARTTRHTAATLGLQSGQAPRRRLPGQ